MLRAADTEHRRGRSRPSQQTRPPVTHAVHQPEQVWSWAITWLLGLAKGLFFHRYLIRDLHSRKIVGWEIFEQKSGEHAVTVVQPDRLRIHGVLERRGTPCFDRLGRGSVECHATRRIRTLGHLTQWSD